MTPKQFSKLRTVARYLLDQRDSGRNCGPEAVLWAESLLRINAVCPTTFQRESRSNTVMTHKALNDDEWRSGMRKARKLNTDLLISAAFVVAFCAFVVWSLWLIL